MPLQDFFNLAEESDSTYSWAIRSCIGNGSLLSLLAKIIAEQIMHHRCPPHLYHAWQTRADGGPPHEGAPALALPAFIKPIFGLPDGASSPPSDHMEGFVAEYLWHLICSENAVKENITRIEKPSFKSTDPGGDGLVIHRNNDNSLMFRLWEIKKCTHRAVSTTVNNAYNQLNLKALEYLARYAVIGQELEDPDIAALYSRLVEFWQNADPEAAAGVAVVVSSDDMPNNCFTEFPNRFSQFTNPPRLLGLLTAVIDFSNFTLTVREYIWRGL